MSLELTRSVAPAKPAITLGEIKDHLRILHTFEDARLLALRDAVIELAEEEYGRAFVTQTLQYRLDGFPRGFIRLPRPPLQSVASVAYTDANGANQTWDSSKYQVLTTDEPARLMPVPDETWPDTQAGRFGAVTITYVAGYGDDWNDVPERIRHYMRWAVQKLRDIDGMPAALPMGMERLLMLDRVEAWW